jgi:SAM-dependent methyltransferase
VGFLFTIDLVRSFKQEVASESNDQNEGNPHSYLMGIFDKLFGGTTSSPAAGAKGQAARIPRRSTGFHEFTKSIAKPEGQTILDLGATSPANIGYITQLGHRVYNEDVVAASKDKSMMKTDAEGKQIIDVERFFKENLTQDAETFDAVLLWDVCDYLPEELVKPVIERIRRVTKPKGLLLGFFHTKDAGSDATYYRYHMKDPQTLEMQQGPQFKLQRAFNNRHIENLFHDFANIKFFLGKENVREVLVIR